MSLPFAEKIKTKSQKEPLNIYKLPPRIITALNKPNNPGINLNPEELKHAILTKIGLDRLLLHNISKEELKTFYNLSKREQAAYEDYIKEIEMSNSIKSHVSKLSKLSLPKTVEEFKQHKLLKATLEHRKTEKIKRQQKLQEYLDKTKKGGKKRTLKKRKR
jgi:hypothetical protein